MDSLPPRTHTPILPCPSASPQPIPLSTMNASQAGWKKFTATVHSRHSCRRHILSFKAEAAMQHHAPHAEKGWKQH